MNQKIKNVLVQTLPVIVISILFVITIIFAWTESNTTPPGGNVAAPLNVSSDAQTKTRGLIIGTDPSVATTSSGAGLIVKHGKAGIGTTEPKASLDVRGDVNFKSCFICLGWSDKNRGCCDRHNCFPLSSGDWQKMFNFGDGRVESDDIVYMKFVCFTGDLVYGKHSASDCITAGGTLVNENGSDTDQDYCQSNKGECFCKFDRSTCPAGWSQYENWSTTESTSNQGGWYKPCKELERCDRYTEGQCDFSRCEEDWDGGHEGCKSHSSSGSHSFSNTPREFCNTQCAVKCDTGKPTRGSFAGTYANITEIGCY